MHDIKCGLVSANLVAARAVTHSSHFNTALLVPRVITGNSAVLSAGRIENGFQARTLMSFPLWQTEHIT
eukprot:6188913-Pleurochrysis_carterae.AAC.1